MQAGRDQTATVDSETGLINVEPDPRQRSPSPRHSIPGPDRACTDSSGSVRSDCGLDIVSVGRAGRLRSIPGRSRASDSERLRPPRPLRVPRHGMRRRLRETAWVNTPGRSRRRRTQPAAIRPPNSPNWIDSDPAGLPADGEPPDDPAGRTAQALRGTVQPSRDSQTGDLQVRTLRWPSPVLPAGFPVRTASPPAGAGSTPSNASAPWPGRWRAECDNDLPD